MDRQIDIDGQADSSSRKSGFLRNQTESKLEMLRKKPSCLCFVANRSGFCAVVPRGSLLLCIS